MKKIISFVLAAAMSLSTLPVLADWNNDEDIMSLLSELNIMVGDDDGNLRLDDNVSRAEFAKIAVASSSYKDTVATGLKVSPFKDVTYTHWSAPYIKAAVSAGIAEGYVDSTFRPDNTVSYEEALTMVLKVLVSMECQTVYCFYRMAGLPLWKSKHQIRNQDLYSFQGTDF